MMRTIVLVAILAACGGGKKPPIGTGGPGSGQPLEKGSPLEEGCKAYAARCPSDEEAKECVARFTEGDGAKKCKEAGKLDAYTQCLVGDCFKTVKCDEGIAMCSACSSIAQCDGGP